MDKLWEDLTYEEQTPEAGYREAVRRIRECDGVSLNLIHLKLDRLPPELRNLATLTGLYLSDNFIKNLSPISELTKLTNLQIGKNHVLDLSPLTNLRHLTTLHIGKNKIENISPIANTGSLKKLVLHTNQIEELPSFLDWTHLTSLHLTNNQVKDLSPLADLSNLTTLLLNNNNIEDISPLSSLTKLRVLNLNDNQIQDLFPLAALTELTHLLLNNNRVNRIDPLIKLKNITNLSLTKNNIENLSPIKELDQIRELSLNHNRINDILPLADMNMLTKLRLIGNLVTSVRPFKKFISIGIQLNANEDFLIQDNNIYVKDNPLTDPPQEVAAQGTKAVLRYWETQDKLAAQNKTATILNREGRILIIGDGEVGKTTLQLKLQDDATIIPRPDGAPLPSTVGVDVAHNVAFPVGGEDYQARVWDFGGQEEQHMTHQYFFGRRSLYLLVVKRRQQMGDDLDYWLRLISLLGRRPAGGKTPVLVALNEIGMEQAQPIPNLSIYAERFPELELVPLPIDFQCPEAGNNDPRWADFRGTVGKHFSELPLMREILAPYVTVPQRLEKLRAAGQWHLPYDEFIAICVEEGLDSPEKALDCSRFLHALGDIIHYTEMHEGINAHNLPDTLLARTVIIDPQVAIKAVYMVLEEEEVIQRGGRFSKRFLGRLWAKYDKADDRDLLRDLLLEEAFEICFQIPDGEPDHYLAPGLLPPDDRVTDWDVPPGEGLHFRFHYPLTLPSGLVPRLIVRLNRYLDGDRFYRSGAVFLDKDSGVRAQVRTNKTRLGGDNIIEIETDARGLDAMLLLQRIRREVNDIHTKSFAEIEVEELVPCSCDKCRREEGTPEFFPFQELKEDYEDGDITHKCRNSRQRVPIMEMITGIYPEGDERLQILRRMDKRGMRHSAQMASMHEVVTDTNERVRTVQARFKAALVVVSTDLDAQSAGFFANEQEESAYFERVKTAIIRLPLKEQPEPGWYNRPLKDKIKVGINIVKLLSVYGIELDGLDLKFERELDISGFKFPQSWADFKLWFILGSSK